MVQEMDWQHENFCLWGPVKVQTLKARFLILRERATREKLLLQGSGIRLPNWIKLSQSSFMGKEMKFKNSQGKRLAHIFCVAGCLLLFLEIFSPVINTSPSI